MPTTKDLLKEKITYQLEPKISQAEEKLLNLNYPVQKIIGYVEMQKVKIFVDKYVLVPRYETEELILKALENIKANTKVLDLCTGSGFIALAIKKKYPNNYVLASDISFEAIEQTKKNVKINNLDLKIVQSNLFENIKEKFDVIVSNPPYLNMNLQIDKSVKFYEPKNALFASKNGFALIEKIILEAKNYLNKNGLLFLEIDEEKVNYIKKILNIKVKFFKDINNKIRIAKISYL